VRLSVAAMTGFAVARERVDRSGGIQNADAVVDEIRDIAIACAVHRRPGWVIESGIGGETAISGIAHGSVACDSRDRASEADLANAKCGCVTMVSTPYKVVPAVSDVKEIRREVDRKKNRMPLAKPGPRNLRCHC
jgi:hypothetical protein